LLTPESMTRLSVNINKIATIRNSRGGNVPNVLDAALNCQTYGAQGITVHPRPDERHIRYADVREIRPHVYTEFNIEGNPNQKFIDLVLEVKPEQVTLVPDAHDAITSNQGWNTVKYQKHLTDLVTEFQKHGIRTSIFVDAILENVEAVAKTGTNRIELYTEPYATLFPENKEKAAQPFIEAANLAKKLGMDINAGHDLSLVNLNYLVTQIPFIAEVSIGHALISEALYFGLEKVIRRYLKELENT
jgi:pyridoxine 5-phosphate synthase